MTVIYLDDDPLTTTASARPGHRAAVAIGGRPAAIRRSAAHDDRVGGLAVTWRT